MKSKDEGRDVGGNEEEEEKEEEMTGEDETEGGGRRKMKRKRRAKREWKGKGESKKVHTRWKREESKQHNNSLPVSSGMQSSPPLVSEEVQNKYIHSLNPARGR